MAEVERLLVASMVRVAVEDPASPEAGWCMDHGVALLRLEINRALTEAISLYRASGYREVEAFGGEPYAHHWFVKRLSPAAGSRE
jgi:hypothetical protein